MQPGKKGDLERNNLQMPVVFFLEAVQLEVSGANIFKIERNCSSRILFSAKISPKCKAMRGLKTLAD